MSERQVEIMQELQHSWTQTLKVSFNRLTDTCKNMRKLVRHDIGYFQTRVSQHCKCWLTDLHCVIEMQIDSVHIPSGYSSVESEPHEGAWHKDRKPLSEFWQTFLHWHYLKETKGPGVDTEFVCECFLTDRMQSFQCLMLAVPDYSTKVIRWFINRTDICWQGCFLSGAEYSCQRYSIYFDELQYKYFSLSFRNDGSYDFPVCFFTFLFYLLSISALSLWVHTNTDKAVESIWLLVICSSRGVLVLSRSLTCS